VAKKRAPSQAPRKRVRKKVEPQKQEVDEVVEPPVQMDLVPDLNDVPEVVRDAALARKAASIAKSKANARFKAKDENLIALMHEHDLPAIKLVVDGKTMVMYIDQSETVKERAPKDPPKAEK